MSRCKKYPPPDLTLYEEILRVERLTEQQLPLKDICRVVGQIPSWVLYTIRFRSHLSEADFNAIKRGHMGRSIASMLVCYKRDNMITKDILHQILFGMNAYISGGVPDPLWELAITLTLEVYGVSGVELLEKFHKSDDDGMDARDETIVSLILHTVHNPPELIEKLEALK